MKLGRYEDARPRVLRERAGGGLSLQDLQRFCFARLSEPELLDTLLEHTLRADGTQRYTIVQDGDDFVALVNPSRRRSAASTGLLSPEPARALAGHQDRLPLASEHRPQGVSLVKPTTGEHQQRAWRAAEAPDDAQPSAGRAPAAPGDATTLCQ